MSSESLQSLLVRSGPDLRGPISVSASTEPLHPQGLACREILEPRSRRMNAHTVPVAAAPQRHTAAH